MAAEYVFGILKNLIIPKMKIKKKEFKTKIVEAFKNIPRHYELSCIRLT